MLTYRRLAVLLLSAVALRGGASAEVGPKPKWASEAVFYQIFPERFRNGDPHNDPTRESLEFPVQPGPNWKISNWTADWYARDQWEKDIGPDFYKHGVLDRRYGGDLKGVLDKMDYLSDLGINAIYFNPLFYSRSLHKYDGNTYHHIDPYFGPDPKGDLALMEKETSDPKTWQWTAADKLFLEVLKQAHGRGMKVIIDGVFNHTGRDFFAFKDLRINQAKSRYKSWYVVDAFDDPATKRNEFSYKGWWGHATLPIFAASADGKDMFAEPKAYIFEATRRWMDPNGDGDPSDGIDGWRLDVADERPSKFWADWNAHVRKLNPNAYTTAEIWKDAAQLVREGGFSASMNYNAFTIPVKGFLIDNQVAPSKFVQLIWERRKAFPESVSYVMQNLMDSHDTDRLASMIVNAGEAKDHDDQIDFNNNNDASSSKTYQVRKPNDRERAIQRLVVLFQMCYIGAPMIYYGDEAGMWGGHDPDDRMPMVWADMKCDPSTIDPRGLERQPDEVKFDPALFKFYKDAVSLRRGHQALNHGNFTVLATDDSQRTLVFAREMEDDRLIVAINRGDKEATVSVKASSKQKPLFVSSGPLDAVKVGGSEEELKITLPPLTGVVLGKE